jgi:RNA polymerase sigma-70 factor (ECF subfamily)
LANDAERWRELLARHGPALLLFARQWSASLADAEDALQNGFVRFWETRGRARDEVAYLYACVRTAAMDIGRGERRRERREKIAVRREESGFEFVLERAERQARIEAALGQLPGDQREVVIMKVWGELTFAQIGEVQGVPMNTAASRYRLALERLAADLAEEMSHG